LKYTKDLADAVNCSQYWGSSDRVVQCLKAKTGDELISADIKAPKYYTAFGPVIDKRSFLPHDVEILMKKSISVFGDTSIMLGVMKNEGFLYFTQQEVDEGVTELRRDKIIRTYVRNVYKYHRQKIFEILMHHYTDWERPRNPEIIRDNLMELLGDAQMIAPLVQLTHYHASHPGSTFLYSFR
jgi:neuroligin